MIDIHKFLGEQNARLRNEASAASDENAALRAQVRDLERKLAQREGPIAPSDGQAFEPVVRDDVGDPVEYDAWGTRRPVMNGKCIMTHAETYEMMRTRWPTKPVKASPVSAEGPAPTSAGKPSPLDLARKVQRRAR